MSNSRREYSIFISEYSRLGFQVHRIELSFPLLQVITDNIRYGADFLESQLHCFAIRSSCDINGFQYSPADSPELYHVSKESDVVLVEDGCGLTLLLTEVVKVRGIGQQGMNCMISDR